MRYIRSISGFLSHIKFWSYPAQIGLRVSKQAILDVNPTADTDRKVVEVKIQIDDDIVDNQSIASLTNLQVQVAIHIQLPKPV